MISTVEIVDMTEPVMNPQSIAPQNYRERVYALCDRLHENALGIVKEADLTVTERAMLDPKILALSLLSRTLSNFRALTVLVKYCMVVEARVLARCCFENLFLVGGLHTQGAEFAKRMIEDDQAGRKGIVRFARESEGIFETLSAELQESVIQHIEMLKTAPKVGFLRPKHASEVGVFAEAYIAYSQFSGDAAHPTISALKRHWSLGERDKTAYFHPEPAPSEDELDQTLEMASIALISAAVAVNEIVGYTETGKKLLEINHEMKVLQAERWGADTVSEGIEIQTEKG
jgi:Family of unknown function (DUF5677)